DQGRPLAAALRFQRLLGTDHARQRYEPELSVLLATCWLMADMPDRASQSLGELESRMPAAKLRAGDNEVSLFDPNDPTLLKSARAADVARPAAWGRIEPVMVWLGEAVGGELTARLREAAEWLMHCGNTARNAETAAGTPLMRARWRVQTANHPNDEELIGQGRKQYLEQGIPLIPTLQPLAVGDTIIMRSPQQLLGVDFETGKRTWMFPWYQQPDEDTLEEDRIRPGQQSEDPRIVQLTRRVWDDAPYGHITSDGKRVFLLWGLDWASSQGEGRVVQRFGVQRPDQSGSTETNKLVALDLQSEGKILWIVGEEDGTDEPKLAGAFFLGPPLPLMGQLYVLAEINGEIRLAVLDAKTGALDWSQQLAHIDAQNIAGDPTRRAAGASPSFADGVLVCPTSSGAVVAVDIANRALLWGYQYPLSSSDSQSQNRMIRRRRQPLGHRWAESTATIDNGRVLVTPAESDKLYCLDLVSGKPVWPPLDREELLFTACIHNNNAIMVGKQQVKAISLEDGSPRWTCELETGVPSGRGMFSGGQYYLPTTASRLLKIDLERGEVAESIKTDAVLGNLVAYKDQIISQNFDCLAAYYQTDPLRQRVAKRLDTKPNDSWALARKAELLVHDGKHREALEIFQRAYELAPQDDSIRASLVKSLLSTLRDDFESNQDLANELENLIEQPEERASFCRWMAVGLKQQENYEEAMRYFIQLASLSAQGGGEPLNGDDAAMIRLNDQLQVHPDRWLQIQVEQVVSQASGEAATSINQMIRAHRDKVLHGGTLRGLKQFVQHFGTHAAGSEARLQLARRLLDKGQLLPAEMQLMELQRNGDATTAATATALLAGMLLDNNNLAEAAMCVQQLRDRWNTVATLEGPTGQEIADRLMEHEALAAWVHDPTPWPYGQCETTKQNHRANSSYTRVYPIEMSEIQGPFPRYHNLVYNQNRRSLMLSDAWGQTKENVVLDQENRLQVATNVAAGQATARGHLLVVNVGFKLVAIDTLRSGSSQTDPVRWRESLVGNLVVTANQTRRTMAQQIPRHWGPPRVVLTDSSRRPIGTTGPIT
ncbi:MAG: PQQ-binding-like beta-propeller repeat protein, partial [Planctomycetota bacterium]